MPDTVQFSNGNQIVNRYAADGRKLGTEYFTQVTNLAIPLTAGQTITQSYIAGVVNQNGKAYVDNKIYNTLAGNPTLARINNTEGYYIANNSSPYTGYIYNRTDHLGNIREVWHGASKTTKQWTQYYPSGLPWAATTADNPSLQPYKYNGKEFDEMNGWDTYDYGARGYYPAMGRFMTVDPLAELKPWQSPYMYCSGNPVNRTDPTGMIDDQNLPEVTVTAPKPSNNNSNSSPSVQFIDDNINRDTPQISSLTPPKPSFNSPTNTNTNNVVSTNYKDPKKDNSTLQNISDALAAIGISGNAVEIVVTKSGGEQIVYVTLKGTTAIANAAKVSSVLKDIGGYTFYLGAILDVAKAANGEQSWLKAGFSIGVARTAMEIGGWPGFVIGGGYILLDKLGAFDGAPVNLPDYQQSITPIDATKTVIPNYSH